MGKHHLWIGLILTLTKLAAGESLPPFSTEETKQDEFRQQAQVVQTQSGEEGILVQISTLIYFGLALAVVNLFAFYVYRRRLSSKNLEEKREQKNGFDKLLKKLDGLKTKSDEVYKNRLELLGRKKDQILGKWTRLEVDHKNLQLDFQALTFELATERNNFQELSAAANLREEAIREEKVQLQIKLDQKTADFQNFVSENSKLETGLKVQIGTLKLSEANLLEKLENATRELEEVSKQKLEMDDLLAECQNGMILLEVRVTALEANSSKPGKSVKVKVNTPRRNLERAPQEQNSPGSGGGNWTEHDHKRLWEFLVKFNLTGMARGLSLWTKLKALNYGEINELFTVLNDPETKRSPTALNIRCRRMFDTILGISSQLPQTKSYFQDLLGVTTEQRALLWEQKSFGDRHFRDEDVTAAIELIQEHYRP